MPIRSSLGTLFLKSYPFKRKGRKKIVRFLGCWLKTPMLWSGAHGITYLLNPNNYIDGRILRDGIYEEAQVEYFCQKVRELDCETFLDVGANIGIYSFAVLRTTNVQQIHAVEPDPKNRNQLAATIFLNEADNDIEVHSQALSDKSGVSVLYAQRGEGGSLSTVQSSLESLGTDSIEILVSTLAFDDLYDWKGKKIAIKMDIEGHEAAALKGMEKLLRNNAVFLQVECFDRNLDTVRDLIMSYGYKELPQLDSRYHDYYFVKD